MKLNLLLTLAVPAVFFAQSTRTDLGLGDYPNEYTSGSANVKRFDNPSRFFKDWSISVGGGGAFMHAADVTSFYGGDVNWGWNAYASLNKQIAHFFGMGIQYAMGQTNQKAQLPGQAGVDAGVATAYTKYRQLTLMGDINFSNLLRRVDNKSAFKWALHGYVGAGFQGYDALLLDNDQSRWSTNPPRIPIDIKQKLGLDSFMMTFGTGLKYNVSSLMDVEARVMYIISGDDSFDAGGYASNGRPPYNAIKPQHSDNMFTANLGLTFKLGKQETHLAWHDPMQDVNWRADVLENRPVEFEVCKSGDKDNDGVCDDWDRELDTPEGARVDGAGVALDMDLDGVIDLYDKCVTVPGRADNHGCP